MGSQQPYISTIDFEERRVSPADPMKDVEEGKKSKAVTAHVTPECAALFDEAAKFHDVTSSQLLAKFMVETVRKAHEMTMSYQAQLDKGSSGKPKFSRLH